MPQPSRFFRSCSQSARAASGISERTWIEGNTGSIGLVRADSATRDRSLARDSLYRSDVHAHVRLARQLEQILERQIDSGNQKSLRISPRRSTTRAFQVIVSFCDLPFQVTG